MSFITDLTDNFGQMYNIQILSKQNGKNSYTFEITNQNINIKITILTQDEFILSINKEMKIFPNNDNVESSMISKLLKTKEIYNIQDLIENISKLSSEISNYCINCTKKLSFASDILTTCGDDKCKYKLEDFIVDNFVCDYIKNNSITAKFLLKISRDAALSPKNLDLFDPFPKYFLKSQIDTDRGMIAKFEF